MDMYSTNLACFNTRSVNSGICLFFLSPSLSFFLSFFISVFLSFVLSLFIAFIAYRSLSSQFCYSEYLVWSLTLYVTMFLFQCLSMLSSDWLLPDVLLPDVVSSSGCFSSFSLAPLLLYLCLSIHPSITIQTSSWSTFPYLPCHCIILHFLICFVSEIFLSPHATCDGFLF